MSRFTVLVVDDEEFVRESLVDLLENEGYRTRSAPNGAAALKYVEKETLHVIVTGLQMPGSDGLSLLAGVRERGFDTPIVLLASAGNVHDAGHAMKAGAFDFIQKPVEPEQFVHMVRRAIEHRQLVREVQYLRNAVSNLRGPTDMIGTSSAILQIRSLIEKVAPSNATVLITGESGSGKDLVALQIHNRSNRVSRNLVRVNCATISESLFESEFFGHRRSAFTSANEDRQGRFREAEGGTLVLDEIGKLRPEMQTKLLRVLETGEYQVVGESKTRVADVRLIAITNENLEKRVEDGSFQGDLFYRLNIFPIETPPLRERKEDLAALVGYFLEQHRGRDEQELSEESLALLCGYRWPGNIRELHNLIERATILSGDTMPDVALIESLLGPSQGTDELDDDDIQIRRRVEKLENRLIREALRRTDGKKREACELLGIDPEKLSHYMRKHEPSESSTSDDETREP